MPNKEKVVILGGGIAGLAAAWRLSKKDFEIHVIELSNRPGGLAGGVEWNGNIYEFGPHVFHTTDQEILGDIKNVMGEDLIRFTRSVKIKFMGEYFNFPLSITDILRKLPFKTVFQCFLSLIYYNIKSKISRPEQENSETVLLANYGKKLYEIFFESYIVKVWGYPAKEFSPEFARQRIPKMNMLEVVEKLFKNLKPKKKNEIKIKGYVEKVEGEIFTTKHGFSLIAEKIGKEIKDSGGNILLNHKAIEINYVNKKAHSVKIVSDNVEKTIDCDHLISTIPLKYLTELSVPKPDQTVSNAANNLKSRATLFVGIVVDKPKALPVSFMYFREITFNRIMDLSYFGFDIQPPNATILIAEVNCDTSETIWSNEEKAIEKVLNDLEDEKIISRDEVIDSHVFKAPNAYPIYLLGYEKNLETVFNWIDEISNMQSIGRQGAFSYVNSHIAMKMAYNAADNIIQGKYTKPTK
jgi:protoporphyrinogen oxidase